MESLNKLIQLISAWLKKQVWLPEPLPEPKLTLRDKIHFLAVESIGTDASKENLAPQDLSCAEGVANILHKADPTFPKDIISTIELHKILDLHDNYERVTIPKPGCIINSPREGNTPGHAGIFTYGNRIISNDSKTGKMQNNYSLDSWIKDLKEKRGLKHIYIHEPL